AEIESNPKLRSGSELKEFLGEMEIKPVALWTAFTATCIMPNKLPRDRVAWAQWIRVWAVINSKDDDEFKILAKRASRLPLAIPAQWIARRPASIQADRETASTRSAGSVPKGGVIGQDPLQRLAQTIVAARTARDRLAAILEERVARLGEEQQSAGRPPKPG